MFAGGRGVLVSLLAMFVSRFGVLFRLFVLAKIVMMGGLVMMMGSSMMMRGGLMMMLASRMPSHGVFLPNRFLKMDAGCTLSIDSIVLTKL
jgi:hypothetical protein